MVAPDGSLDALGVVASLVGDVGKPGGPGEVQAGGDTAAAGAELPPRLEAAGWALLTVLTAAPRIEETQRARAGA